MANNTKIKFLIIFVTASIECEKSVIKMTHTYLDEKVKGSDKTWLLLLCNDNTDFCQALIEGWYEAANIFCERQGVEVAFTDINKDMEMRYMFEVSSVPKVVVIKKNKVYAFPGKPRTLEDFIEFAFSKFHEQPSSPLPEPKSTLQKIWFLMKSSVEYATTYLDTFGLQSLDYSYKVILILALFVSLFVGIVIWSLSATSSSIPRKRLIELQNSVRQELERMRKRRTNETKSEEKTEEYSELLKLQKEI